MELCQTYSNKKINDFDYNFLDDKLAIIEGKKVKIFHNEQLILEKEMKIKNSLSKISFFKEKNQLFGTNLINIADENAILYKLNIASKRSKKLMKMSDKFAKIKFLKNGYIVYLMDNTIFLISSQQGIAARSRNLNIKDGRVRLDGNEKWIIIDYRENLNNKNSIYIYNLFLNLIEEIHLETSIVSSVLNENKFYYLTKEREIYFKNIENSEEPALIRKNVPEKIKKLFYEQELILASEDGGLIFWDSKEEYNIHKNLVKKICVHNKKCISMDKDRNILVWKRDKNVLNVDNFMEYFNISNSYEEFFNDERKKNIIEFINSLIESGTDFAPEKSNIFKALQTDLEDARVLILGKDPYFQVGAATGLAFEVNNLKKWTTKIEQKSLQNIIRVIYKAYHNRRKTFSEIREKIEKEDFEILEPDEIFKYWKENGVILLNSFLTVEINDGKNSSGSHSKFWDDFSKELIEYISTKNPNMRYFLWGNHAKSYKKFIKNGTVFESRHPSMSFGKVKDDFLFFKGFKKTKNIIDWLGRESS